MKPATTQNPALIAGELLLKHRLFLCVAESCTGGLLGHLVTDISGCSDYFLGGVQAYSYQTKTHLLSVKPETLEHFGAVSHETASEMAIGARQLFSRQQPIEKLVSLSITGIAGPGGGTPSKPVGLVWIGLSYAGGTFTWQHNWLGNRQQNKMDSANAALNHLLEKLSSWE
ncbi:MAG: CinA family protein [Anaerolineae bacterium]|nr:CinA family protein [Anaerolineae bacterium]